MSVESTDKPAAGEGVARRLTSAPPPTQSKFGASVDNLYSMFAAACSKYPDNQCFGTRTEIGYDWITYDTAHKQMLQVGSGIRSLTPALAEKSTFGMYMANVPAFQIVAIGCFSQGMTCVPIYDTLGDNIVEYEVKHADIPIMFVEDKKLKSVGSVLPNCPTLKHVVQIQALGGTPMATEFASVNLIDLTFLCDLGSQSMVKPAPASGDDLAFIMYTSGTTGDPKGVCIKHLSIVIGASYCAGIELYPTDRYLSYLPLAHIFETMVENAILSVGGSVGFYGGNIKMIQQDILALAPTVFVGVPRIYQRFYERIEQKMAGLTGLKKCLIPPILAAEIANRKKGKTTWRSKLLGKKVGALLHGGSVRLMISGAAPLPMHVQELLLATMGCPIIQGYGMTENCANATLMYLDDYRSGHVGPPMPTVDIKLVDVPEMNYTTAENNSGEVCTKGAVNFAGYHKNEEETAKVLDADGWLHTGDIGRWNPDGTLSIIDRKKNIFKLSQGEYIAAEKIEMCVSKSKYVAQPWIYGNSFLPMLVAVVTPDYAELHVAAAAGGWDDLDNATLAKKPEAKKFILDAMIAEAKTAKLKTFELPQAVYLEGEINELLQGFSIDNDCLTPTFKLKRPQLLKKYQEQVNEMYRSLGEDPSKAFAK